MKWEYLNKTVNPITEDVDTILKDSGLAGWELVNCFMYGSLEMLVFKRKLYANEVKKD